MKSTNINKEVKIKKNQENVCPICCADDLNYGSMQPCESGIYYFWDCYKCGASGKEFYNTVFSSHGQVKTKCGNEVLNEHGY